jgi:dihydrofolate reductase
MKLSLIVAMAENRVIGRDNQLPWRLPADLKHFKQLTLGKPVVMGRHTWESIGRPLPGRTNIVVTRDDTYRADGALVAHSIDDAMRLAGEAEEVMIIGGATLYEQTIERADRIYLTLVHAEPDGDSRFPEIDPRAWRVMCNERLHADEKNPYDYDFTVLVQR